jgi:hypothetical protein
LVDFSDGRGDSDLVIAGAPSSTFEEATKAVGARVRITLRDGRQLTVSRSHAAGSAGPETRRTHRVIARHKLLATGVSVALVNKLDQITRLDAAELDHVLHAVLSQGPADLSGGPARRVCASAATLC